MHLLNNNEISPDIENLYTIMDDTINSRTRPIYNIVRAMTYYLSGNSLKYDTIIDSLTTLKSSIRNVIVESFTLEPSAVIDIETVYEKLESLMTKQGNDKFQVITTNYDLVIEKYCEYKSREVIDGFVGNEYSLTYFWRNKWEPHSNNPVYLNKLHGSVSWQKQYDEEREIIKLGDVGLHGANYDVMIAPTLGEKDYNRIPFNALLRRFENTLKDIDVLIVIGFSYRDYELNKIIQDRLKEKLVIISISATSNNDTLSLDKNRVILTKQNSNITQSKTNHKPRVYSYDSDFGPNTIDDICHVLDYVYTTFSSSK